MKSLENYGVQELNATEIRNTDGGAMVWDDILVLLGIALVVSLVDNFGDAIDGASDGWNAYQN